MRYFLLLVCWLSYWAPALAQKSAASAAASTGKGQIQGLVADSLTGKPLREASVSLLAGRDSSYLSFTITDGDGRFALRNVAPGRYFLLTTFLGYKSQLTPVTLPAGGPAALNAGTLRLKAMSQTLGEVVIQQERAPVSVSGDTLAFSAKAFKTQPNAAVESLLKKLPGVEVDRDGNIKAHGQDVQRVLVDGKPFFGDDPKMATRNLPADIIDQVQLYNARSDQAAFSGIDDGNQQKTLNLVTKRDKRKGYFGQNGVGVGTDGRYQARLGLNRFNNGRQLSAIGQANNINQLGFGDNGGPAAGDASAGPGAGTMGSDLPGGFGGGSGGGPTVVLGGGQRNRNSGAGGTTQPIGILESVAGGLNYRDAWGKRAEVATSYFASRTTLTNQQQIRRENVATGTAGEAGTPLLTQQLADSRSRVLTQRFNFRLDYQVDSLTSLRFTPNLWWRISDGLNLSQQQTSRGALQLNESQGRYDALANTLWGGGNALLMRKFAKQGRTFSANLNTVLNNQDGDALNQATNTFFAPDGAPNTTRLDQRIAQDNPARTQALNLSYTEPLSLRRKLELHYNLARSHSRADRRVSDLDEATQQYTLPNYALSNRFSSDFLTNRAGLTVQTSRLRFTYGLGLDAQQADLRVDNQSADTALTRHYQNLLPNAMFSWTGSRSRNLRFNYRTRLQAPTATQLQPVADNTNPLNVRLGNPHLRPEYVHSLTATYSQFNAVNNRSVFLLLGGNQVQNRIVSATSFSARGVQTTRPVNADGYATLNGFVSLGQRLSWHKLNVNLTTNGNLTRNNSFVNELTNQSRSWSVGQGLSLNSAFNDQLEFGLRGNVTYQRATYSLLPQQNSSFLTQTLTADVYYQLPGRWVFTSDVWMTNYSGRAAGYNQRVLLWNASIARQFFANKQGELKLQAYDILRQNRSVVRNITDTYLEDVRSRVLTQYFLLSFTYNLRQFGK
ncbi:outer membrane beta-barrel protein [Hymenobacter busanensis]|uniref:Outer membrane beta-barrel protein n=1 Tax=Hymenobacter busanensis TaxID=2607656 RepID=A0A7L4ZSS8_9BACT|nr:outer membrane beta-barrel family protein [Hymenobacter busanensis]KAA9327673.1 outer membrane beta-barrel protein [Hymenobacter busanensis]QHJ05987.1 outer membrane beta-barrel protein [Hymenobacter busanensis]